MFIDTTSLLTFMAATIALLVVPGPAVLYIVARSIDQGRLAGLVSVMGIQVGVLFHILAAALGLSVILVTSALAFSLVKFLGAAYLIYLGVRTLMKKESPLSREAPQPQPLKKIFRQGIIVNVLNPKSALFFFAFLPQFVDASAGPAALQILFLGTVFVILAMISDSTYAMLAGTLGNRLRQSRVFLRGQKYLSGTVYIGLGLTTALAGTDKS
ncbi:MAG: LysE family translocator [Chloroflexi bacterium]|nr:LysE family translocator [Chloroflexota bacterium]